MPGLIILYDKFDPVTVAHEMGHAWDYETGGKLTAGLMNATGARYLESFGRSFNDPSVMDSSIFKGFQDIGFLNSPEDWARSKQTATIWAKVDFARHLGTFVGCLSGRTSYRIARAIPRPHDRRSM